MWEDFNLRVKSCTSYASAAREALWLFRQLKSEVLNDTWVQAQPNGVQSFETRCLNCPEDKAQARGIVQELEFAAINWEKVHKLWALERPPTDFTGVADAVRAHSGGGVGVGARGEDIGWSLTHEATVSATIAAKHPVRFPDAHKKRERPGTSRRMRGGGASGGDYKRQKEDPEVGGFRVVGAGGRISRTSADEFDNFDGDEEGRGGGEGNVEREELNGKSQVTLGSVVVVQLDDDTTAFGIVSSVPHLVRDKDANAKTATVHDSNKYEVTFMDDQVLVWHTCILLLIWHTCILLI
jgi:hypothetical protein